MAGDIFAAEKHVRFQERAGSVELVKTERCPAMAFH